MSAPYYVDESVTLWLGDCLEHLEWWTGADVLVTDPPYGVGWKGGATTSYRRGNIPAKQEIVTVKGDKDTQARDGVLDAWGDRPAIVFGSWRSPRPLATRHRLIWHKAGQFPGPINAAFVTQDEEIYVLGQGYRKSSPPQRSVITTREIRSSEVARIGHPTPKPVSLMELLIDRCPPGVIADPFAGSGSTLIAAAHLGRRAIGVEIDERYCEIAARRRGRAERMKGARKGAGMVGNRAARGTLGGNESDPASAQTPTGPGPIPDLAGEDVAP